MCIDFEFYANVYGGTECDYDSLPSLLPSAMRAINTLTRFPDIEQMDDFTKQMFLFAVCAQIDFLAINGSDYANSVDGGFTVGKVTVQKGGSKSGRDFGYISPTAMSYLEQTGLLYPGVPVMGGCRC